LAKLRIAKQLEMEGNKLIFRAFFVAGNRLRGGGRGGFASGRSNHRVKA
jgi:hypothetical protein